jgi:hypothetical protein
VITRFTSRRCVLACGTHCGAYGKKPRHQLQTPMCLQLMMGLAGKEIHKKQCYVVLLRSICSNDARDQTFCVKLHRFLKNLISIISSCSTCSNSGICLSSLALTQKLLHCRFVSLFRPSARSFSRGIISEEIRHLLNQRAHHIPGSSIAYNFSPKTRHCREPQSHSVCKGLAKVCRIFR